MVKLPANEWHAMINQLFCSVFQEAHVLLQVVLFYISTDPHYCCYCLSKRKADTFGVSM